MVRMTYIFVRLIKSGSTTIIRHIRNHAPDMFRLFNILPGPLSIPKHIQIIGGHDAFYPMHEQYEIQGPYRYFTILRDPADWLVSNYHHDEARRNTGRDFWEWYEDEDWTTVCPVKDNRNLMFKWYARYNNPYELLDNCWFVGIAERTKEFLPWLFMQWGLPLTYENEMMTGSLTINTGEKREQDHKLFIPQKFILNEQDRKRLWEENPQDVKLYEYAKRLYEERHENKVNYRADS